jgi:hypothetical protein
MNSNDGVEINNNDDIITNGNDESDNSSILDTLPIENTIYIRGLEKNCSINIIFDYFIKAGNINCIRLSRKKEIKSIIYNEFKSTNNDIIINQGFCWIVYENSTSVDIAIRTLHHTKLMSTYLFIRKEAGYKPKAIDKSITSSSSSLTTNSFTTSIPRDINKRNNNVDNNKAKNKKIKNIISYTGKGIVVEDIEYPTPTGIYISIHLSISYILISTPLSFTGSYITSLLKLCYNEFNSNNNMYKPLLKVITCSKGGNKHAKEISESMSMVNGLKKIGGVTIYL